MDVQAIIDDIDWQFAQMRRVRELFVSIMKGDEPAAKRPNRPKGSTNKPTETSAPAKRTMTAESKARIAGAQKARWAAQKKAGEPATHKYAVKQKAARKTTAKAKKTALPKAPLLPEAATTDA